MLFDISIQMNENDNCKKSLINFTNDLINLISKKLSKNITFRLTGNNEKEIIGKKAIMLIEGDKHLLLDKSTDTATDKYQLPKGHFVTLFPSSYINRWKGDEVQYVLKIDIGPDFDFYASICKLPYKVSMCGHYKKSVNKNTDRIYYLQYYPNRNLTLCFNNLVAEKKEMIKGIPFLIVFYDFTLPYDLTKVDNKENSIRLYFGFNVEENGTKNIIKDTITIIVRKLLNKEIFFACETGRRFHSLYDFEFVEANIYSAVIYLNKKLNERGARILSNATSKYCYATEEDLKKNYGRYIHKYNPKTKKVETIEALKSEDWNEYATSKEQEEFYLKHKEEFDKVPAREWKPEDEK